MQPHPAAHPHLSLVREHLPWGSAELRILALSEASQYVLIRDVVRRVHEGVDCTFVTRYSVKKNVGVKNEAVTTLKEHAA